jgi:hypothetical protein
VPSFSILIFFLSGATIAANFMVQGDPWRDDPVDGAR